MSARPDAGALHTLTRTDDAARDARRPPALARRLRRAALSAAVPLYGVLWVGGVLSQWLGGAGAEEGRLASLFLLTAGLIVMLGAATWRGAARLSAVVLLGFAVEAVGVRFGVPFGEYAYTGVLRPRVLGVPFVMGFAWMVLVAFASDFAVRLRLGPWPAAVCAALLTTATDLVIDPLAANQLGYWIWKHGGVYYGIPFTNFVGWFLTALPACRLLVARGRANRWAAVVGTSIVLFFAAGALANSLVPVALVGLALCAARLVIPAWRRRPSPALVRLP
ncbi:MAG TPA: carotenoid biosynthesis protein [Pyrinomonadaceae bacterium]